jgi:predicted transcriptional regulator
LATISIRIEETEKEALQEFAKEHDLSVSQVVRKAIKEFLKMNEIATEEPNKIPN